MCMGYNRALVNVRHPSSLSSHNAAAATALLIIAILPTRNPEARSKTPPVLFAKY
jgi:hypothetical protein